MRCACLVAIRIGPGLMFFFFVSLVTLCGIALQKTQKATLVAASRNLDICVVRVEATAII